MVSSYLTVSILSIISDNRKFNKIGDLNNFKFIFKIEDKIYRFLLKLKTDNIISDDTYDLFTVLARPLVSYMVLLPFL